MSPQELAADRVVADLIEKILSGHIQPGSMLPSEADLAEEAGVSRLTIREAIKILRAQRVVEVQHGRGTLVNAIARWSPLDATLLAAKSQHTMGAAAMARKLLEARRLVEVGVAELAAARRTESDLDALAGANERMKEAGDDVDMITKADLAFHQALMAAAGNAFIASLFDPLEELLYEARRQTKVHPEICAHAIAAHARILKAVRDKDPEGARWAMHDHLMQTEEDLEAILSDPALRTTPSASPVGAPRTSTASG